MDQDFGTPIASTEDLSEPPKKRNSLIIILVVVLVVLCCCCVAAVLAGGVWLWNNGDELLGITRILLPFAAG